MPSITHKVMDIQWNIYPWISSEVVELIIYLRETDIK